MTSRTLSPSSSTTSSVNAPRSVIWKKTKRRPRILLVTPELSESHFLSQNGKNAPCVKAGGLADVSALLVDSLSDAGADVHVALPHFRSLFQPGPSGHSRSLHLCKDREFSYRRSVYDGCRNSNLRASLAFQRDVIHYVLPRLKPDVIHCHDWMTGLVPAAAKSMGIPSLFTVHNLHDEKTSLGHIEDRGIDAASFWENLYFQDYPWNYESCRSGNAVSMLASGILAADHMNTVSRSFLGELAGGNHNTPWPVVEAVRSKMANGRAHGILNSLPNAVSPDSDPFLPEQYNFENQTSGKRANKLILQKMLGLEEDADAPVLFWPSRLDPVQKGCQLLADILYRVVSDYWALGLQVVFVGDGPFQQYFEGIAKQHNLSHRIAVRSFSEGISRLGYAGSDFTLMPSSYEPCGLSQMVGLRYGSLPIVHSTGGLRDTVTHIDSSGHHGNGFAFEYYDAQGLRWAIDEAIRFHIRPSQDKAAIVSRIMRDASDSFSPHSMVEHYLNIYKDMLNLH